MRPDGSTVDQLANLVKNIKEDPYSRRHILSAWNPGEIEQMACLLPCFCSVSRSRQPFKLSAL